MSNRVSNFRTKRKRSRRRSEQKRRLGALKSESWKLMKAYKETIGASYCAGPVPPAEAGRYLGAGLTIRRPAKAVEGRSVAWDTPKTPQRQMGHGSHRPWKKAGEGI